MNKIISALTLCLVITGCGDVKEASEKNFEVSIQRYLDASFPTCFFSHTFPADTNGFSIGNNNEMYEELTKLGLLDKTEEMRKQSGLEHLKHLKPIKVNVYQLNEKGLKVTTSAKSEINGMTYHSFCVGKAKVNEILDFTEPSDMFGRTISDVNFTFTTSDVPDWAKTATLLKLSDGLKKIVEATEKPIKGEVKMVLTNKGWKHIQQDSLDERKLNKN